MKKSFKLTPGTRMTGVISHSSRALLMQVLLVLNGGQAQLLIDIGVPHMATTSTSRVGHEERVGG